MLKIFSQVVSESVLWGLIEKEENKYLTCCKLLLKTACIYSALLPCSVIPGAWLHWLVFFLSLVFPILCLALCPGKADMDWLPHHCLALWLPGGSDPQESLARIRGRGETLMSTYPGPSYSECILWQPLFQTHNLVPGGGASCFPEGTDRHNCHPLTTEKICDSKKWCLCASISYPSDYVTEQSLY